MYLFKAEKVPFNAPGTLGSCWLSTAGRDKARATTHKSIVKITAYNSITAILL